jgi:hypothetical protein
MNPLTILPRMGAAVCNCLLLVGSPQLDGGGYIRVEPWLMRLARSGRVSHSAR